MKKIISVILSFLLATMFLVGCSNGKNNDENTNEKLKIVTTVFPVYDWAREIVGKDNKNVEIELLLKNGTDLHSYQPSAKELAAIADADVFVHVGGISDIWVKDALKNEGNPNRIVVNLFDTLGDMLKPLKITDGMEHHHEEHEHHHDEENDEHIWLSIIRAKKSVQAMAESFAKADSKNAEEYLANAKKYEEKLDALDNEYRKAVELGKTKTVVFADRFPFFYMADDYSITYYAAFTGCSAESEASFETVAKLAKKIDELGIKDVITIENRAHKIPETIIESTKTKDQKILTMNSLQSVTDEQIAEGLTYFDVMKSNLEVLKTALK